MKQFSFKRSIYAFFLSLLAFTELNAQNTLDLVGLTASTPAQAAYSLRKLCSTYAGKAIQVRRSNDDATQDIGFTAGGNLDTVSLKAFIGSNDGLVTIWYDQSGNARDLTQPTTSKQPTIIKAGVVYRKRNRPAIYFDITDDGMLYAGSDYLTSNPLSVNVVAGSNSSYNNYRRAVQGTSNWLIGPYFNLFSWYAGNWNHQSSIPWTQTGSEVITVIQTASSTCSSWRNGVSQTTNNYNGTPNKIQLGTSGAYAEPLDGHINEVIAFNIELNNTDRVNVETSQSNYYQSVNSYAILSNLTVSTGNLQPAFADTTLMYYSSFTTEPTANFTPFTTIPGNTIQYSMNGGSYNTISSGNVSDDLPIPNLVNTLNIRVTAQDGITHKNYIIYISKPETWTGANSTDWNDAGNWDGNIVPTASIGVIIPTGLSNYPVINTGINAAVKYIKIAASNASLTLNANSTLTVNGYDDTNNNIAINNYGTINNNGSITNSSISAPNYGIYNQSGAIFSNAGTISIANTATYGIYNSSSFTNSGTINIVGKSGTGLLITTTASFNNSVAASVLNINGTLTTGILLQKTFSNSGTITIGTQGAITTGISITGTAPAFTNATTCASLYVLAGNFSFARGTVTNKGLIQIAKILTKAASGTTFSNQGVLKYATISGSVTNTGNAAVIVKDNTSPIFTYGGTYSGTVNGIYSDAAATVSAGSFSAPNSFTPGILPGGLITLYAQITPTGGCTAFIVPFVYNNSSFASWTGTNSTDWNDAGNWDVNTVPTISTAVVIPVVTNYPVLTAATNVGCIKIITGATISMNGQSLTTAGITGLGTLIGSATSSLTIHPINSYYDTLRFGTGATDSLLANLSHTSIGLTTVVSGIGITNLLSVTSGGLNSNGHLSLKSTSIANTAIVGPVGGTITGNVTLERYIPKGVKAYRSLITGGLYNAGSIFNNWQEAGVNTNGYGIFITGKVGTANGVDLTTGFDVSPAGIKSMYNYLNYMTYSTVNNTKTTNLDPYTGYLTVVYGNRSLPLIPSSVFDASTNMHSSATIRTTGQLVTGTVTYSNTGVAGNYSSSVTKILPLKDTGSFIANPYACSIDWETLSRTNLTTSYYYYEPTFVNGGYQSFVSYNGVSHTNSNPTKSKINRYIQPGQGFWIQTNSTVTSTRQLVITEANKVTNQPFTAVFGTGAAGINRLAISLWKAGENVDGAVAVFDNNFTSAYGDEDSKKILSAGENIFITEKNQNLSIDGLAIPSINDVIALQTTGMTVGKAYTIQLDAQEFNSNGLNAYLVDATQQTEQLLTAASNTYSFTAYKVNDNRFSVMFKSGNALPVKFLNVKANQGTDKKTNVISWTVANEINIDNYEVEQSATGKDYAKIATANATNNSAYTSTDNTVHTNINYYRIKAVDKDGKYAYSQVVKLSNTEKGNIVVAPNPVRGSKVAIQMNNLEAGKYSMNLYNYAGQLVTTKEVLLTSGNTTIELPIGSAIANGVYSLSVRGVNNYTTEVIINK